MTAVDIQFFYLVRTYRVCVCVCVCGCVCVCVGGWLGNSDFCVRYNTTSTRTVSIPRTPDSHGEVGGLGTNCLHLLPDVFSPATFISIVLGEAAVEHDEVDCPTVDLRVLELLVRSLPRRSLTAILTPFSESLNLNMVP